MVILSLFATFRRTKQTSLYANLLPFFYIQCKSYLLRHEICRKVRPINIAFFLYFLFFHTMDHKGFDLGLPLFSS